jgi:hypothetical protein
MPGNMESNMEYIYLQKVLHDPLEESATIEIISTFDSKGEDMYVAYLLLTKVAQPRVRGSTIADVMARLEEECRKRVEGG